MSKVNSSDSSAEDDVSWDDTSVISIKDITTVCIPDITDGCGLSNEVHHELQLK